MRREISRAGIGSEFGLSRQGGYHHFRQGRTQTAHLGRTSLTANGRAALGLAARYAQSVSDGQRDTVLLPAYLCHSVIQPFVEMGLPIRFYQVAGDLSVVPSNVSDCIDDQTLAVVLVHYFGFEQLGDLSSFLVKRFPQVMLIDDRTHSLLSDLFAGMVFSDQVVAVYSPRKWGPFPDLGIVVWPRDEGSRVQRVSELGRAFHLSFAFWKLLGMLVRALFFAWPAEILGQSSLWMARHGETILDRGTCIERASPVSRFLWQYWDWVTAGLIRRKNYRYLLDNWPRVDVKPLFGDLAQSTCPLGFPILSTDREKLREHLISKHIFPPIHWLRPSEVSASEFPEAARLAESELTIPIDQRYGLRHMDYVLEAVCHA